MELFPNAETVKLTMLGLVTPESVERGRRNETANGRVLAVSDRVKDVEVGALAIFRDPTLLKNGKWYNPNWIEVDGKKCMFVESSDILVFYESEPESNNGVITEDVPVSG